MRGAGATHLKQHMRREPSGSVMMREWAVNFPDENSSYAPTVSRFSLFRPWGIEKSTATREPPQYHALYAALFLGEGGPLKMSSMSLHSSGGQPGARVPR